MTKDRSYLTLLHLSQLGYFIIPYFGGILFPLFMWVLKKEEIEGLDFHAKKILNFQISMMIYIPITTLLIVFLYPFWILLILILVYPIVPILNTYRASKGYDIYYPLSINFLK